MPEEDLMSVSDFKKTNNNRDNETTKVNQLIKILITELNKKMRVGSLSIILNLNYSDEVINAAINKLKSLSKDKSWLLEYNYVHSNGNLSITLSEI